MKMGEFSDMTEEMYSALRAKLEEQLSSCVESHRKNIEVMVFNKSGVVSFRTYLRKRFLS